MTYCPHGNNSESSLLCSDKLVVELSQETESKNRLVSDVIEQTSNACVEQWSLGDNKAVSCTS